MAARLPLRAVPQDQLRAAWSAGRTYYEHPRREPRGLEKAIETMTLEELVATQGMEPLSESRRSFLTTGVGVSSLDAPAAPGSVSVLMDYVADDGPRCLFDMIDLGIEAEEAIDTAEIDARRYGVPYDGPDFRTRDQIQWEQYVSQCGPAYRLAMKPSDNGGITVENIGQGIRPEHNWLDIARGAIQTTFASIGGRVTTFDELKTRVDLLVEGMSNPLNGLYRDPDAREELERQNLSDDEIVHSSYEALDDEGNVLIHHRSTRRAPWERWHHELPRWNSDPFEMGMDLCSNEELESLLGVTDWDDDDNLIPASAA